MAKRKLLKDQDRRKLFDVPIDEDSFIRHYSLSLADRLEIELRRRNHNRLGFAIQLCLMRYRPIQLWQHSPQLVAAGRVDGDRWKASGLEASWQVRRMARSSPAAPTTIKAI